MLRMPKITIEEIDGRVTVTIEPGPRKPPAPLGTTRGEQCGAAAPATSSARRTVPPADATRQAQLGGGVKAHKKSDFRGAEDYRDHLPCEQCEPAKTRSPSCPIRPLGARVIVEASRQRGRDARMRRSSSRPTATSRASSGVASSPSGPAASTEDGPAHTARRQAQRRRDLHALRRRAISLRQARRWQIAAVSQEEILGVCRAG